MNEQENTSQVVNHWFPGSGEATEIAKRPGATALCGAGYDQGNRSASHPYQVTCLECEKRLEK